MINQVYIELTKECNLNCIYCSNHSQHEAEISLDKTCRLLEDISKLGVKYLRLYGGEPLMSKKLIPVLRKAYQLKLKTSIYTNGLLLNPNLIEALKRYKLKKILLGCDSIEPIKGTKYFSNKLVKTITQLKENNIAVDIIVTVSKLNHKNIKSIYEKMYSIGVDKVKPSFIFKMGKADVNWNYLYLDKSNLTNVFKVISELELKYKQTNIKTRKCHAAVKEIFIASNGNVYPCPLFQFDEFIGGNINDKSLIDIIKKPLSGFLEIQHLNLKNLTCSDCSMLSICGGGCRAAAYSTTNSLTAPNLVSCIANNK